MVLLGYPSSILLKEVPNVHSRDFLEDLRSKLARHPSEQLASLFLHRFDFRPCFHPP